MPDIKDAGILAGFERWGWPWHGLCQAGIIAGSGTAIPVPDTGHAWLIDKGLPPVALTPDEAITEAAANREWLNYGMISGGVLYGTRLPRQNILGQPEPSAFIHVDEDGINWLIALSGSSFPAAGVCRVFFSIVRFGHFEAGVGAQAQLDRTVDIPWTTTPDDSSIYPGAVLMWASLQDVWVNGSRALIGVFARTSDINNWHEMYSLTEIEISGHGGIDGSGLVIATSEIRTREQLSPGGSIDNGPNWDDPATLGDVPTSDTTPGYQILGQPGHPECLELVNTYTYQVRWEGSLISVTGHPLNTATISSITSARYAFYDSYGEPKAMRCRWVQRIDHWVTGWSASTAGSPFCVLPPGSSGMLEWSVTVSIEGFEEHGYELLLDDVVVDRMVFVSNKAGTQRRLVRKELFADGSSVGFDNYDYPVPYHTTTEAWETSSPAGIPASAELDIYSIDFSPALFNHFRAAARHYGGDQSLSDGTRIGIHRTPNAAAFFVGNPVRQYGVGITPIGPQSVGLDVPFFFSWHPKTGASAFSASPVCWV